MRQGQNFVIHGGLIQDANNEYTVRFNTAPQSWVVGTALRRGRKMWEEQYKQILREGGLGKMKPKYWDWKVYLNQGHREAGGASLLEAKDEAGTAYPSGEWGYSQFASEDVDWSALPAAGMDRNADEFTAHIVGNHVGVAGNWTSVGLIESWKDSRPIVDSNEPEITTTVRDAIQADPLTNLFDEADADDERINHLADHNDAPPYDATNVPGTGATGLERMAMAATSAANPIVPFNGFIAPHGLIEVHCTRATTGLVTILMDVEAVGGIY